MAMNVKGLPHLRNCTHHQLAFISGSNWGTPEDGTPLLNSFLPERKANAAQKEKEKEKRKT
jgi:hypothetical protein